jgi:small subunit ribosomal protein S1
LSQENVEIIEQPDVPSAEAARQQTSVEAPEPAVQLPANPPSAVPLAPSTAAANGSDPDVHAMPGAPVDSPEEPAESEALPGIDESGEIVEYEELIDEYTEGQELAVGDICRGTVVSVTPQGVIVDIGRKTEGIIPLDESAHESEAAKLTVGQEIDVRLREFGAPGQNAVLSHHDARQEKLWDEVEQRFRQREPVAAKVIERVKGGVTVDVGLPAFLPGSQADIRPVHDLEILLNQEFPVRIVKINRKRGNIVVSRRELLEEELTRTKQSTLATLKEGEPVTGAVKNVTDYGVFIDLGGIDGLLHVTDISYGRIKNPAEMFKPGDAVTALVLKLDVEKERVSLSLKHMAPDPWEGIEERYQKGMRVFGRVASSTDYGSFIELENGVEGLIHVSEMSWSKRLKHPSKILKPDDQVESVVLKVNRKERRISLSLKQLEPDPWTTLKDRYSIGSIVEGRVRNITQYGVFVEVEDGVDGLVHTSDISWSRSVQAQDVVKKGQIVRTVVLHIDPEERRLSLGIKQLEPDVWETFFSTHQVDDTVRGKVTRLAKFGAFVEIAAGIEGLCHSSEMSTGIKGSVNLEAGHESDFKIVKLDEFEHRVGLSRRGMTDTPEKAAEPEPKREKKRRRRKGKSEDDAAEAAAVGAVAAPVEAPASAKAVVEEPTVLVAEITATAGEAVESAEAAGTVPAEAPEPVEAPSATEAPEAGEAPQVAEVPETVAVESAVPDDAPAEVQSPGPPAAAGEVSATTERAAAAGANDANGAEEANVADDSKAATE